MSLSKSDFAHLHNHSDFSMLDGAAKVSKLVQKVASLGQKAVALTDHGNLHGAYDLWHECQEWSKKNENNPVKPIIGVEAYVTPGTARSDASRVFFGGPYGDSPHDKARRKDDVSAGGSYTHMTIWASDNEALRNLSHLQSVASTDRVFSKYARIDRELLSRYSKGLLATTGCPSGAVQTYLRLGMYDEAVREASELQDIFGKDNFWVELMDHGIEFERRTRNDLLRLAKDIGAPLLATNDLHYVEPTDAVSQDALLCINSGDILSNPDRFKFDGSGYYVKSTEEMFELFSDIPQALTNTMEIVERCDVSYIEEQGRFMPHVPFEKNKDPELEKRVRDAIEIGEKARKLKCESENRKYVNRYKDGIDEQIIDEGAYFISETMKGLNKRFPDGIPDEHLEQIDFEINTILDMGFPSYFLVVSDFVRWAKENGIFVGPGRGSAAGSLVAYALEITDLDPIEHKLVFERFLNPERVSLPDIDIDFEEGGREKVIDYCAEKYGSDNVAQIITFNVIKAKQALKDSARIMDKPYAVGDILSKNFPDAKPDDKEATVANFMNNENYANYKSGKEFRDFINNDSKLADNSQGLSEVVEKAQYIEGLIRGWGVHASGVIVSPVPIKDYCPVQKRWEDGAIITQFEAKGCEQIGFVKMDFLGLKNLNTNKAALENIRLVGKEVPDLLKIPLDDEKTFNLIANAETLGVFQLDGDGMRSLLKRLRPTNFNDISATIALFRPGPMGEGSHINYADRKNGKQKINPIHPAVDKALEDILGDTYGLVVFQEQIQFAARKLANYSMGQADILRRAMGKKKKEELDAQYSTFEAGMLENGYPADAVKAVWDVFEPFADYAFNRAHTACYAYNAYTNAYLKANFPVEYMSALLTTNESNQTKLAIYLAECARMQIKVEVPSVNHSHSNFSPDGQKILFGLAAIRNVGEGTAEEIIKARVEKGRFESFLDFLKKVPESVLNKRKIESLIKAGAFDEFGVSRRSLVAIHLDAIDQILPIKRKEAVGQFDIFDSLGIDDPGQSDELEIEIPELDEWNKETKLDFEKEMLGLYVSDHPLSSAAHILSKKSDFPIVELNNNREKMESFDKGRHGTEAYVCGLIKSFSVRRAKKTDRLYGVVTLEDLTGSAELLMFGKVFDENKDKINSGLIVRVGINIRVETERVSATVSELEILESINSDDQDEVQPLKVSFKDKDYSVEKLKILKEILLKHPGDSPVQIEYIKDGKKITQNLPHQIGVEKGSALFGELKSHLGFNILKK